MKVIIILAPLLAVILAAPQQNPKDATILKYESDNIGIDGYKFEFETSDGVSRSEQGEIRNAGSENEGIAVSGKISWVALDGTPYTLQFVADENGYQPVGDHIPK